MPIKPKPATKVGVYVRISRDAAGERAGVERQRLDSLALCEREGWDYEVYEDNDISASKYSRKPRPEYERLLRDLRSGAIGGLVAYNQDRLTRQPRELEDVLTIGHEREAKGSPIKLRFATGLSPDDNLLTARIMAAVAAQESDNTSRRVRAQKLHDARKGKPGGGGSYRPFGYERDGVTIVEPEATVIRDAYRRILAGESAYYVGRSVIDSGIVSTSGEPFCMSKFYRVLKNPRYAGFRVHKGDRYPAAWPGIVSPEDHEALCLVLDAAKVTDGYRGRRHLLSGFLTCSVCGSNFVSGTIGRKGGTKFLYRCSSNTRGNRCHVTIGMAAADEYVIGMTLTLAESAYEAARTVPAKGATNAVAKAAEAFLATSRRLDALEDAYAAGSVSDERFFSMLPKLDAAKTAAHEALATAQAAATVGEVVTPAELEAAFAPGSDASLDARRSILATVLRGKILVLPAGNTGRRGTPIEDRLKFP